MPDPPATVVLVPKGGSSSGFARVDASWSRESGVYDTSVHLGVGTDGRPRLEIVRGWDG